MIFRGYRSGWIYICNRAREICKRYYERKCILMKITNLLAGALVLAAAAVVAAEPIKERLAAKKDEENAEIEAEEKEEEEA